MVGIIQQVHVRLGDQVKKGQILAEIEHTELSSLLENAEREAKRVATLLQNKTVTPKEYDSTSGNLEVARAALEKSIIRAPFDGIVVEHSLEVGQLSQVTTPKPLLKIVDVVQRYVRAEIDEVDLSSLAVGKPVRLKILAVRREPFRGTIRKIIPFVSTAKEQDRTTQIEISVVDEPLLLPAGASAEVEVILERKEGAMSVPTKALLGRTGERFLFSLNDKNTLDKIEVKTGIQNYEKTEILSPLTENTVIVFPPSDVDLSTSLTVKATQEDNRWRS
jgi:HlyD family secretion protein